MDDEDASRYERRLIEAVLPYDHHLRRGERPHYEELPLYQPPAWLLAGVWLTDPAIVSGAVAAAAAAAEAQCGPAARDSSPNPDSPQQPTEPAAPVTAHDDRTEGERRAEREAREQLVGRGTSDPNSRSPADKGADRQRLEKYSDR
jgi:hypothetical protein